MRHHRTSIAAFALCLVGLSAPDASGESVGMAAIPVSVVKDPSALDPDDFKSSSANLSLQVANPIKAAASAERLIRKMGGEIESSSGNPDSAHLSARLGERRLQAVIDAVRAIPGKVASVSRNTNDYAQNARRAVGRLERLSKAEGELVRALKVAPDADAVDGLMLLRELTDRERQQLENEIDSLRRQSVRAQLHIRFDRLK